MPLFKSKSNTNKKDDGRPKGDRKKATPERGDLKKVKYVWLSSHKAIFIITGEPRESKYSYSVPIIPLHGIYYSSKDKRKYTAKELSDYFVVLNIDEEDADALKGKKVVVLGYNDNEMLVITAEGGDEKNGDNKA
jgi:phosphotransferase system HPr-like phosphotransfer protein